MIIVHCFCFTVIPWGQVDRNKSCTFKSKVYWSSWKIEKV